MKVTFLVVAGFCHCSKMVLWKEEGSCEKESPSAQVDEYREAHTHTATNLVPSSTHSVVVTELLLL